jgi:hypothetical protein
MLGSAFARLPNPSNPLMRYMVVREEVTGMEKHAKVLLEASRASQQAYLEVTAANTSMQSALAGWGSFEQSSVSALNGRVNGSNDPAMRPADDVPKMINRMSQFYSEQHSATSYMPDYAGVLYSPSYEYEYNRCTAFLELFKYHDDLSNFIDKQRSKVEKIDRSKAEKLAEAQAILEEKKICLAAFYKGMFFFTVPMAARDRSVNVRRAAGFTGSTMLVSSCALEKASLSLLRDMDFSPAAVVASTSVVLEQLSLRTLDGSAQAIADSTWRDMPPLASQCQGLLRAAMGIAPDVASYYAAAAPETKETQEADLAALLRKAEIEKLAARTDPFEEEDRPVPPPVPAAAPEEPIAPPVPAFQPDQQKVSSLLGDLTGEAPGGGGDNLWS